MTAPTITPEQLAALDAARALASAGIPVFVAPADASSTTGFALPRNWQHTAADPSVVDRWQPGMAIAAVTGHGLDVVDVDPRNGGDVAALNGRTPVSYGAALTPSGGVHSFIRSLGVAKRTNVLPGIDVQAGAPDGSGRGFVFLAPTVRASKVTGEMVAYRWAAPPDLERLRRDGAADLSGLALAELVRGAAPAAGGMSPEDFMKTGPWANIEATLAEGRNNGVAKLAAALRGRGGWRVADATRYMYAEVWPLIDQAQGGHPFAAEEFEAAIAAQWRQYPDGAQQREAAAATPPVAMPDGQIQAPPTERYFGEKGVFHAATLAGDITALGPLAQGRDDTIWAYRGGVWRGDKHVVRNRAVFLLGERYRPNHTRNSTDIVLSMVPGIDCEPIPELINVRNGLLEWRTGVLREHTPNVPSTVQLNVTWDPAAQCPAFEQFLAEVVAPDVVDTMWELIGYLMFSGNPLHKAVMFTGTGRNGKGTFLHVVEELLGRPNITNLSLHSLIERFGAASLFGKLANIAGDIDPTYIENTAVLKAVTGGDTISAEHKFRDRFDFRPWAVPVFSANKIPGSADTTVGYLSRWLVVNFPHDFTGREDRGLGERLSSPGELAGIAVRGLAALPRLLERGDFVLTDSARDARDDFVRRVDQVRTWLFDCAELTDDGPWAPRTELYQAYQRWAGRDGHRPVKASEFYDRIEAGGARPAKVHGVRGFGGIRILDQGHIVPVGAAGAALPIRPNGLGAGEGAATQTPPSPATTEENDPRGQRGQVLPYLSRARVQEGGLKVSEGVLPAPMPPRSSTDSGPESARITRKLLEARDAAKAAEVQPPPDPPGRSAKVRRALADKRAETIRARIAEAAGELVELPALVLRDGTVSTVDLDQVCQVLDTFGGRDELTVDVETTGFPVGHADYALRTIQLGGEHAAVVLDADDPAHMAVAGEHLAAAAVLHAHSATADLVPLAVAGVLDLEDGFARMHDTVIPAKLADPASTGSDPGLKQLAAAVLREQATSPAADDARAALFKAGRWLTDTKATTPRERSGWAQVDPRCTTMVRYAASDVLDDAALARLLPPVVPALLERERIAAHMTARVAYRGLLIDGGHVRELLERERGRLADAAARLGGFGVENPGGDVQVGAAAVQLGAQLPRTPTGRVSVAAGSLEPYRHADGPLGQFVRARLDYQKSETAIGLILEPYHQLVEHGDGRARPTVYTLAADTGRMSCVRPNLQQVPREGGYRACMTADPGTALVSADFAGVELRVAAALSGDTNLRRLIAEEDAGHGDGVHWAIARLAFGPDATKADRYATKRGVFGRIYGGGITAIARGVGVSETTAAAIIDALDAMLPELTAWSASVREAVKAGHTQFPTYSGRTVHLPRAFPHKAPNYCIQGTARELLVDTLVRLRDTRWGTATLLPVHDEVLLVVPESDAAAATQALVAAMESELHGVPIRAEASQPSIAWQDAS